MKKQTKKSVNATGFWSNRKLQAAIIIALVFTLYARVVKYEYIGFDDTSLIVDNFKFLDDFSNIPQAFSHDVFANERNFDKVKEYYRPIMTVSLMLDAHIAGSYKPPVYHFFNVFYHIVACILLFILFFRLGVNAIATFLLTLIFAVHPVLTQAVAWIPGRNDILLTIFTISSFLFLLDYIKTQKRQKLLLHILLFAFALFSKENALMLVFASFFYMQFIVKGTLFSKTNALLLSGYLLVIIPWFLLRKYALEGSSVSTSTGMVISNIFKNSAYILPYIGKTILPLNLSVIFMLADSNYIFPILSIIGMAAGIYFTKNKRWSRMAFGCFWFLVFLLPSFSASFVEGLEHRLYLPLIGILIMVSEFDWLKNLSVKNKKNIFITASCVPLFAIMTNNRIDIFKNRFNFYLSAISTSKHAAEPCINLAADYQEIGNTDKAIEYYKMAIERDPNKELLHNNLGTIYLAEKNYEEAEKEFLKELEISPNNGYTMYNLALVYVATGRIEQAVIMWKKDLTVQPDNIYAYQRIAEYYKQTGDIASYNYYESELQERANRN